MSTPRTDHKDRLFQKLFGAPENRENLLSLYNALNGTAYTDTSELEITTIEDVIYMGMKNDVSCIVDDYMSLKEHQSTFNPNMPLRGFMYFGRLYDKYIKQKGRNLYGKTLIRIPTPKYFVLYNGDDNEPDAVNLKLSDAFIHPVTDGSFEWTAVMLNINYGHNQEIMDGCQVLKEYAIFVAMTKANRASGMSVEEAVTKAVDECIEKGILKDYFIAHKAEVIVMCITEYNEAETMQAFRQEGIAEGIKQGIAMGARENARKLFENGASFELIRASIDGFTDNELREIEDEVKKSKK